MNAGLGGFEISDTMASATVVLDGKKSLFFKDELGFKYRKSSIKGVITSATFKVKPGFDLTLCDKIALKRKSQPQGATFGSVFKNPPGNFAGALIEKVGLKGFRIGDVGFSSKHANFMINYAKGEFGDAISLITLAKKRVEQECGIKLECEVVIL